MIFITDQNYFIKVSHDIFYISAKLVVPQTEKRLKISKIPARQYLKCKGVMGNNNEQKSFYSGGFLYNPKTRQVLLHLRDAKAPINPNKWAFFGGISENDETPKECFVREMQEELNIGIAEHEVLPLCDYLNTNRGTWRYVFYVQSELPASAMKLGEGADFRWIPLKEVFNYDLTKSVKSDLETFLQKL